MSRATLDKQPHEVAAMFDAVARRYDLMNDLMSLGQDRMWRAVVIRTVGASAGQRVLDLAAGTGTSSASFTKGGADCVACDFSLGMLRVGAARNLQGVGFVAGDALALPFADASFDATTISFGLRNVHDVPVALAEMARVTKPGGRLVICEFSRPTIAPLRAAYHLYLRNAMPALARLSSNPESYRYLAESILAWPDQPSLARMIGDAGWQRPQWRNLSVGIVAIHRAVRADHAGRPADPERGTSSKLA